MKQSISAWAFLLAVLWLTATTPAWAIAPQNQIPSCYAANKITPSGPVIEKDYVILIDQTTMLDSELKTALANMVRTMVKPGNAVSIMKFSAYTQGRYMDLASYGEIEAPLPAKVRNSIGVKVLKSFDACMIGQQNFALKQFNSAIGRALQESSFDLKKSDVFSALAEAARVVKNTKTKQKAVLIVSDMLENSAISSFYQNNNVRLIDPIKEIKGVQDANLLGDFSGASVYVMGAGLVPEAGNGKKEAKYRDPKTLGALKKFWSNYFDLSNAKLMDFGTPALLTAIP